LVVKWYRGRPPKETHGFKSCCWKNINSNRMRTQGRKRWEKDGSWEMTDPFWCIHAWSAPCMNASKRISHEYFIVGCADRFLYWRNEDHWKIRKGILHWIFSSRGFAQLVFEIDNFWKIKKYYWLMISTRTL
jgi:hypothetical protein